MSASDILKLRMVSYVFSSEKSSVSFSLECAYKEEFGLHNTERVRHQTENTPYFM